VKKLHVPEMTTARFDSIDQAAAMPAISSSPEALYAVQMAGMRSVASCHRPTVG
jgi:hypothetical protein